MAGPLSEGEQEDTPHYDSLTTENLQSAIRFVKAQNDQDVVPVEDLEPLFSASDEQIAARLAKLERDGYIYKPRNSGYDLL